MGRDNTRLNRGIGTRPTRWRGSSDIQGGPEHLVGGRLTWYRKSGPVHHSLEQHLRDREITDLVIVGLTTDHCVSTSVRMAANLGFNVRLAGDATATHGRTGPEGTVYTADEMHRINLASLHGEFCEVVATADVIAAL